MSGISTARKVGIFGRVAARQAGKNRVLRAGYQAVRVTLGHFGRVLHLLFLQITGVFFLLFATVGAAAGWKEYRAWSAGRIGPGRMYLAAAFGVLFAWFAVSSFWRAGRRASGRS